LVLTDREIQAALDCGQIKIAPVPVADAYSSTSVDLTLSKFIRCWKCDPLRGVEQIIAPSVEGYNFNEVVKQLSEQRELDG
jgi:deoxycytidine triphosphate deaminase